MREHHQGAINRVAAHFADDPRYLALLVGGSVAKGWEEENSDVDILLVATDDEYARCVAAGQVTFFTTDFCDYPDGYVDGKILNRAFLQEVADHGSEPARAAFSNAIIVFSQIPDLPDLLREILTYPEAERDTKMRSFYSQVMMTKWFISEAEKRSDAYLLQHGVGEMVLFAGRLMLAYNRVLYPYHKWFMHQLRTLTDVPDGFMSRIDALLETPGSPDAVALMECLDGFRDWGVTLETAVMRFLLDSEWNWRGMSHPPLHDW